MECLLHGTYSIEYFACIIFLNFTMTLTTPNLQIRKPRLKEVFFSRMLLVIEDVMSF